MSRRVSLTRSERASGIGAELLALCQTVTDDGYLAREEIAELRRWLKDNRDSDLPAITFLHETVERILADRRITREERQELYQAIELVLPPEARREAVDARREAESEREHRERIQREKARNSSESVAVQAPPRKREVRRPSRPAKRAHDRVPAPKHREPGAESSSDKVAPLATSKFMLAGVHHDGRAELIEQFAAAGDQVFLARDPASPLSPNAIEVRLENGYMIGFVPEEDAVQLAPLLDEGCPHFAEIKAIVEGGRAPVPVVTSRIYEPGVDVENLVYPEEVPSRDTYLSTFLLAAWQSQVGWAVMLGVVLGIAGLAYWLFR
ncbi:MAG: hypothetical protein JNG90_11975 [Planctomycetaceae bacterium]|nr:hypothetical protein [Planctomycetaceae bacterium]